MKTDYLELYTDYLISGNGYATATGLSAMMDNEISHDQVTRFLSKNEFTSKELWKKVKKTVREVESGAKIPANHFTIYIGMLGVVVDVIFVSLAFIVMARNIDKKQKES